MSRPDPAALPADPGAYALDIRLDRALDLAVGRLGGVRLPPGRYLYVGSAFGPGGIRARVRRHLAPAKRRRWHVDYLTAGARIDAVLSRPGGRECALVAALLASPGVTAAIPGFGSSDCRAGCPAHLLAAPPDLDLAAALRVMPTAATQADSAP